MSVYIEGTRTRSGLPYPPKTKIFEGRFFLKKLIKQ